MTINNNCKKRSTGRCWKYLLFFGMVLIFSCGERPNLQTEQAKKDSLNKISQQNEYYKNVDCDSLLGLLVKSTNLDKSILNNRIEVVEVVNGILRAAVTDRSSGKIKTLALIDVDIKNRKLMDVTKDPSQPVMLTYDSIVMARIIGKCQLVE